MSLLRADRYMSAVALATETGTEEGATLPRQCVREGGEGGAAIGVI